MITSIHYKNFKALRDCRLPLGRFTLIVGPNGSGKSTAMQALKIASKPEKVFWDEIVSIGLLDAEDSDTELEVIDKRSDGSEIPLRAKWTAGKDSSGKFQVEDLKWLNSFGKHTLQMLNHFRIFTFSSVAIANSVMIRANLEIESDGSNLAGVLDNLQGSEPEKFEELNVTLGNWLPEFDRIVFDYSDTQGHKALLLRTRVGKHKIKATDLSQGTLLALAYLTVAYLPNPPTIVCFEEPDRGIHPRLLKDIRDAMYRLAYPEDFGEKREPVQVIATTHSPYLLDLYKDHPEEIVIANKDENGGHFERLSDKPHYEEFLQDVPLGDVWYSGVLGGVPIRQ